MSKGNVSKVIVVGNLGHDPELRYTAKGNAVTTFSLATSRGMKNAAGEKEEKTYWHRATVWGKRAESCAKYLGKGASVYVEGQLELKDWVDKEGKPRKSAEILVDDIRFLTMGRREKTEVNDSVSNVSETPALAQ
ncbi:MAG: single-stranded DNA-binding protein [Bacteriovoracia bacterium]